MARVTFTLAFETPELCALDLPIEVRKPDSTIVARALASESIEIAPGHYYASAGMPAGQRLLQPFEVTAQPLTVTLAPDAEDESAHEWEGTSHYMTKPRSTRGFRAEAIPRQAQPFEATIPTIEGATASRPKVKASFRLFAGNPVSGELHLERAWSHLSIGEFERGRIVQFLIHGGPAPLIVQLVESGWPVRNMAIPVAPSTDTVLVFTRRADGICAMDVHLPNYTADMLLAYCASAALQDASEARRSRLLNAERLLEDKGSDPIAAAVAACAILRFGQLRWLHEWTANLDTGFPWLPDGAAIRGEHLARQGKHVEASARLFEVSDRGLPIIGDALFYTVERLKWYASLPPDRAGGVDVVRAAGAMKKLLPFAAAVHRQRPVTSYCGLDPARPNTEAAAADVAPFESIELAEWLSDGGPAHGRAGTYAECSDPTAGAAPPGASRS